MLGCTWTVSGELEELTEDYLDLTTVISMEKKWCHKPIYVTNLLFTSEKVNKKGQIIMHYQKTLKLLSQSVQSKSQFGGKISFHFCIHSFPLFLLSEVPLALCLSRKLPKLHAQVSKDLSPICANNLSKCDSRDSCGGLLHGFSDQWDWTWWGWGSNNVKILFLRSLIVENFSLG